MIFVTNDDRMGKNILHLRQKHNLSQEAFSRLTGMDRSSLDAVEKGTRREMESQVLMNICESFRVGVKEIVEGFIA